MTESEVHVHVHLVMAGTFPLRVADLLFTDDTLIVPEYEFLTPLFGLARGQASTAGALARQRYASEGVAGLVEMAERTHRIAYDDIHAVRIYGGGRVGRPKVAVDVMNGPPYAYRVHAPLDIADLITALRSLGCRRGFDVFRSGTLGFSPTNSVRRFLADR